MSLFFFFNFAGNVPKPRRNVCCIPFDFLRGVLPCGKPTQKKLKKTQFFFLKKIIGNVKSSLITIVECDKDSEGNAVRALGAHVFPSTLWLNLNLLFPLCFLLSMCVPPPRAWPCSLQPFKTKTKKYCCTPHARHLSNILPQLCFRLTFTLTREQVYGLIKMGA